MKSSYVIVIIVVLLVLAGAIIYFRGGSNQEANEYATRTPSAAGTPMSSPSSTSTPSSSASSTPNPGSGLRTMKKYTITATDSGYSPSTITIKAGDTVIFKNGSSQPVWTASAVHPTHRAYPTTGGCLGSTFDACRGIPPGQSWSFKFDIAGSWKYHNHLNPSETGTIVIQQ